jgi:hypothetical protein
MHSWEIEILNAVENLGREANLQVIYNYLEKNPCLTQHDRHPTHRGGRPAYQHQVRSHISNLYQALDLTRVARDRYRITPQGLGRIERDRA